MRRKTCIWKGALAGIAGGLAGTLVMTEFQHWMNSAIKKKSNVKEEPATVKAAQAIAEKTLHRRLRNDEKNLAGQLVHYTTGTLNGLAYGAIAEVSPVARTCAGTLFGTALFVLGDEIMVPLMGWGKPPNKYPWSSHLY